MIYDMYFFYDKNMLNNIFDNVILSLQVIKKYIFYLSEQYNSKFIR